MKTKHEWMKVIYKDETNKRIDSKWIKVMNQGIPNVDKAMREGLAEAMQPRISWEIVDTCMNKPNLA
jgi:hypothetical protein